MIRVHCPGCRAILTFQDTSAGQVVACTECPKQLRLPELGGPRKSDKVDGGKPVENTPPSPKPAAGQGEEIPLVSTQKEERKGDDHNRQWGNDRSLNKDRSRQVRPKKKKSPVK